MTQMSPARTSVLERLGEFGRTATVNELAGRCEQHPNTVREHLDALVAAGLVKREPGAPRGRGRPPLRYGVLPPEASRPILREYAALASALAGHIARHCPDPAAAAVEAGRRWGAEIVEAEAPDAVATVDPAAATVTVLDRLGFAPRTDLDAVRLLECPLLAAARRDPEVVCGVHAGLVRGLCDAFGVDSSTVSLDAFAEAGACVVHLPTPPSLT